ncbi:GNAT family N-acetyltransferase [Rhizobium laguerreae]|nr:GNAT family N-acetyltransferase [Rhizobium laguerreae]
MGGKQRLLWKFLVPELGADIEAHCLSIDCPQYRGQRYQRQMGSACRLLWSGADEGQGYALEASRAYLEHALGALATQPVIARIHRDNLESRKLASRLGGILDDDAVAPAWSPQALTYRFSPTRP